jgi:hypothetical protein
MPAAAPPSPSASPADVLTWLSAEAAQLTGRPHAMMGWERSAPEPAERVAVPSNRLAPLEELLGDGPRTVWPITVYQSVLVVLLSPATEAGWTWQPDRYLPWQEVAAAWSSKRSAP